MQVAAAPRNAHEGLAARMASERVHDAAQVQRSPLSRTYKGYGEGWRAYNIS